MQKPPTASDVEGSFSVYATNAACNAMPGKSGREKLISNK